jgi:hypothetical protein
MAASLATAPAAHGATTSDPDTSQSLAMDTEHRMI